MQIGTFNRDSKDTYSGEIRTLLMTSDTVSITPVLEKQNSAGPDFVIIAADGNMGDTWPEYEIGAAWERTSRAGKKYLKY